MPNFKPKTNKKIEVCPNKITTLDSKHSEIMKKIEDDYQKEIPKLLEKRKSLKNALKNIKSMKQIEERLDLEDKLNETNEKIRKLKKKKTEYLLDNANYVFNYFESRKNISEGNISTSRKLNSFFKIDNSGNNNDNDNNYNNIF